MDKMRAHPAESRAREYADRYNEQYRRHMGNDYSPTAAAWAIEADEAPEAISETTQGLDGAGFLGYYDKERTLSFIWNGDVLQPVEVSHGGYGEPRTWTFFYNDHRPLLVVAGSRSLVLTFQMACQRWIEAKEDAR